MFKYLFIIFSFFILFLGCKPSKDNTIIELKNVEEKIEAKVENHEYKNEETKTAILEKLIDYGEQNYRYNYREFEKSFSVSYEEDIIFLTNFTQEELSEFIEYLVIQGEKITDINFIENFPQLKILVKSSWNMIDNIEVIGHLYNLKFLRIDYLEKNTDLSPISNLVNLVFLSLGYSEIKDLSPISNLENLEELDLTGNKIENIDPIFSLINLKSLSLDYYDENIERLQNLEYLYVPFMSQDDLYSLASLKKLRQLVIFWAAGFDDVSPLLELQNLEYIEFGRHTNIDITPLAASDSIKTIRISGDSWYNSPSAERDIFWESGIKVEYYY
jgi:Leucine-rich repeat (LRR) protein